MVCAEQDWNLRHPAICSLHFKQNPTFFVQHMSNPAPVSHAFVFIVKLYFWAQHRHSQAVRRRAIDRTPGFNQTAHE